MSLPLEEIFHAICPRYDPDRFPEYFQRNPIMAYGEYTFEQGFKLAFQLAVCCLDPDEWGQGE